jgi:hypothetical protein
MAKIFKEKISERKGGKERGISCLAVYDSEVRVVDLLPYHTCTTSSAGPTRSHSCPRAALLKATAYSMDRHGEDMADNDELPVVRRR